MKIKRQIKANSKGKSHLSPQSLHCCTVKICDCISNVLYGLPHKWAFLTVKIITNLNERKKYLLGTKLILMNIAITLMVHSNALIRCCFVFYSFTRVANRMGRYANELDPHRQTAINLGELERIFTSIVCASIIHQMSVSWNSVVRQWFALIFTRVHYDCSSRATFCLALWLFFFFCFCFLLFDRFSCWCF